VSSLNIRIQNLDCSKICPILDVSQSTLWPFVYFVTFCEVLKFEKLKIEEFFAKNEIFIPILISVD
jgi:hypothetical protein